jgi:hypothetical protein
MVLCGFYWIKWNEHGLEQILAPVDSLLYLIVLDFCSRCFLMRWSPLPCYSICTLFFGLTFPLGQKKFSQWPIWGTFLKPLSTTGNARKLGGNDDHSHCVDSRKPPRTVRDDDDAAVCVAIMNRAKKIRRKFEEKIRDAYTIAPFHARTRKYR